MDLKTIARALGGEVVAGAVSCPGPGHSIRDRSLRVFLDRQADGVRVHSLAGDDWRACGVLVARRLGISAGGGRGTVKRPKPVREDDSERSRRALAIWADGRPIDGTPATAYLLRRRIDLQKLPNLHHALRFHPRCPWAGGTHGAMVAVYTDILTGEPRAIHRTAITPAGEKSGRKMLGPAKGCAIRLSPDEAVGEGLALGEGLETSLSLLAAGWSPTWACGSAGGVSAFPVIRGIESLTIFADDDDAGISAAKACRKRWQAEGWECNIILPPNSGTDWNDTARAA
jgi:putative DNA primase/helicase